MLGTFYKHYTDKKNMFTSPRRKSKFSSLKTSICFWNSFIISSFPFRSVNAGTVEILPATKAFPSFATSLAISQAALFNVAHYGK